MLAHLALIALLVPSSSTAPTPLATTLHADAAADVQVTPATSRAWALLASSVLFERNGYRHDLLAGLERASPKLEQIKTMLKDDWDIETPAHLLEQLQWLEHGGHRTSWEKHFRDYGGMSEKEVDARVTRIAEEEDRVKWKTLWKNASRAAKLKGGVLAWDYGRYVALCRWGYAAGYLTQEEAWKRMDVVVKDLQKAYTSWEEFGTAYCIGYDCWRPGKGEETEKAFERLKTSETSPWKTTPWKQKLVSLEKAERVVEKKK